MCTFPIHRGVLWDLGQHDCGICEISLLLSFSLSFPRLNTLVWSKRPDSILIMSPCQLTKFQIYMIIYVYVCVVHVMSNMGVSLKAIFVRISILFLCQVWKFTLSVRSRLRISFISFLFINVGDRLQMSKCDVLQAVNFTGMVSLMFYIFHGLEKCALFRLSE